MQDIRYFIKLNLSNKGTFYFLKHIIKYIKPKNLGGSRTNHQLTQCLQILNYVLEISSNKIKENDKFLNDLVEKQEDFKQTLALLDSSFQELFASEKESNSDGNKNSSLNGIIIFTHRLFSFLKKYTKIINKLNPEYNEISKIFRKITSQMKKLIINRTELKIHEEKLMSIEETFN